MKNIKTRKFSRTLLSIITICAASLFLTACTTGEDPKVEIRFDGVTIDTNTTPRNTVDKCLKPLSDGVKSCVGVADANVINPVCWLNFLEVSGTVVYNSHGRNDSFSNSGRKSGGPGTTKLEVKIEMTEIGGNGSFRINGQAQCPGGGPQNFGGTYSKVFGGENPTNQQVRDRLVETELHVAAYQLSKFDMFASDGMPLYSSGFGVGQLKSPASQEIWNWAKNVDATIVTYGTIKTEAQKYPKAVRDAGGTVPDFTASQLKAEVYQQWVGEHYWVPNANKSKWIKNSAASDFGDKALQLESEINSGQFPADW